MAEGRSLICHIIAPTTKFIFLSTMPSPKRPASGACGLLGHNCQKCPAVPAAATAPVAAAAVNRPNFENNRTMLRKPIPPLLLSQRPMMMLPTLIGEVFFMLFLILKQLEEVGRGMKSSSWPRSFWIVQGSKLKMPFSPNLSSQQNPYHPSFRSLPPSQMIMSALLNLLLLSVMLSLGLSNNMPMNLVQGWSTTSFLLATMRRCSIYLSSFISWVSMELNEG
jgi:hypothetical protein